MQNSPLVSILIPTYNRSRHLPCAIRSALSQDYQNIEVIVVRDGGHKINDIVESLNDPRLVFIDRDENHGIPYTLNQGLRTAKGKYICYLGDDDILYPHHVSTLLDAIENKTDCLAVYSDLYRSYSRNSEDGQRIVLSKVLEISRDFDRFMMLYFNHVLHVSMMHRKDLIGKTGFYNENINVLVDWDLFRRMAFFTDFYHVKNITGEFYSPVNTNDRVSVKQRKDAQAYLRNVMTIRTTRPAKPWPKLKDMAIIVDSPGLTQKTGLVIKKIWETTFTPCTIYLPLPESEIKNLNIELPNIIPVPVSNGATQIAKIKSVLEITDAEYIAIVPEDFNIRDFWIEDCVYAMEQDPRNGEIFELEDSTEMLWAAIFEENLLRNLLSQPVSGNLHNIVKTSGLKIRKLQPDEIIFQYDQLLSKAKNLMLRNDFAEAAKTFDYIADNYGNELWIKILASQAHLKSGNIEKAKDISNWLNRTFPTTESLITEAKVEKILKNNSNAIELFENALDIIEGKQVIWT